MSLKLKFFGTRETWEIKGKLQKLMYEFCDKVADTYIWVAFGFLLRTKN